MHGPVRAQFVGMYQAVCLFGGSTSLAFGADSGDVLGDALVSALLRGAAGGGFRGPVRAQIVGMSQAVCVFGGPTSLAFGTDFEDVSGDSLASAPPKGAARGYCTGPVRAQFVEMSQAVRLFGGPTSLAFGTDFEDVSGDSLFSVLIGGTAGVGFTGPLRANFVGMSQAVCLFRCPTSFAFVAVFEDVSGGALVPAPQWAKWGCLRRFASVGEAPGRPREGPGDPRRLQEAPGGLRRP